MNTNETNNAQTLKRREYPPGWFKPPIANGELPGQGVVTVGCYRSASGEIRLVPVLTCYRVYPETGTREQLDQVLVGPAFTEGGRGFDWLSRANARFTQLYSDAVELPRLPADESQRTELVLAAGPSRLVPEWVAVGVWDGHRVRLVGYPYRDEGDNVCRWLWQSNLPHVTAYASPAVVSDELDWSPPADWPWPWPGKRG